MLRTAPVTQLDNRAKRGHRFCFLGFLFPQMRELESSIPDTLQGFFLTVGGFFLNKELKLNDSSCQTKVWVGGWGEGRINTVLLLGTRDRLKGVTQREVAPEGGNPSLFFGGGKSRILILFVVICSCAVVWLHTCFFHCVVANKPELKFKKQREKKEGPWCSYGALIGNRCDEPMGERGREKQGVGGWGYGVWKLNGSHALELNTRDSSWAPLHCTLSMPHGCLSG